jgi:DNA-binding NarL/FixJ family response regulator
MIQVAITDDHPLVIDGLVNALQDVPGMEISGMYAEGESLLRGLQNRPADVLLLDLQLPGRQGSELVPLLLKQHPALHILILSSIESSQWIKEMMRKGCKGYLLKSSTGKLTLVSAIREVYEGRLYLEPGLKEQLLQELLVAKRKSDRLNPKITHREREVLKMIVEGLSNLEIAARLFISLRTVETHRYNLAQKLNTRNTAGLVSMARQLGIE